MAAEKPGLPIERHYTARQIAETFGVNVSTVYAEQDAGRLAYLRFGGRRVVPESAILDYVQRRAVGNHPQRPLPEPTAKRK